MIERVSKSRKISRRPGGEYDDDDVVVDTGPTPIRPLPPPRVSDRDDAVNILSASLMPPPPAPPDDDRSNRSTNLPLSAASLSRRSPQARLSARPW